MIKKLLNFVRYTWDILVLFKIPSSWLLNKLWFERSATNILCKKPYILYTPFWNYLAITLFHYFCVVDNYEPEIWWKIDEISKKIKWNDKYLINIGANIWRWSIWLAKKYWYKVMAFEPWPSTFKNLKINTLLSDLEDKIELFNVWLWNSNDTMKFSMWKDCDAMWHIVDDEQSNNQQTINVPVKKFDDLWIDKEKIDKTRLIIMDVEWYELNVLKWMKQSLSEFHDIYIVMEIWEWHENKNDTIKFMEDLWYKKEQLDKDNWVFHK